MVLKIGHPMTYLTKIGGTHYFNLLKPTRMQQNGLLDILVSILLRGNKSESLLVTCSR